MEHTPNDHGAVRREALCVQTDREKRLLRVLVATRVARDALDSCLLTLRTAETQLSVGTAVGDVVQQLRRALTDVSEGCVCFGQPLLQGGELSLASSLGARAPSWRLPDLPTMVYGDLGLGGLSADSDTERVLAGIAALTAYVERHRVSASRQLESLGEQVGPRRPSADDAANRLAELRTRLDQALGSGADASVARCFASRPGGLQRVA